MLSVFKPLVPAGLDKFQWSVIFQIGQGEGEYEYRYCLGNHPERSIQGWPSVKRL